MKYILFAIFLFSITLKVEALENDTIVEKEYVTGIYYNQIRDDGHHWGQFYIFRANNQVVNCIEPGRPISNLYYSSHNDWGITNISNEKRKELELISYYGYNYVNHQSKYYFMATQKMIWEALGVHSAYFTDAGYGGGNVINIDYELGEIRTLISRHNIKPTHDNITITGFIGDTFNIGDATGELSKFSVEMANDKEVAIVNKGIIVRLVSDNEEPILLSKNKYIETFVYTNSTSQMLTRLGMNDQRVFSYINVDVLQGEINIKLDGTTNFKGTASLENAVYEVINDYGYIVEITTDIEGRATIDGLGRRRFIIRQKTPSNGYLNDYNEYIVDVHENNLVTNLEIDVQLDEKEIVINKTHGNTKEGICYKEKDASFEIYNGDQLIETIITNENGIATINLPFGEYLVKQINTSFNYEPISDFNIIIDSNSDDIIQYDLYSNEVEINENITDVSLNQNDETEYISFKMPKTSGPNKNGFAPFILLLSLLIFKIGLKNAK